MRFELEIAPLDLDLTLGCGQTFRWRRQQDASWLGVLEREVVVLRANRSRVTGEASPGTSDIATTVETFLRAEDDIGKIQTYLRKDSVIGPGIGRMNGLRIVKHDEWECLISYILATYANIPRIMKMIDAVATEFGPRIAPGIHAFPERKALAKASQSELARLGLGYRAKYVRDACREIDENRLEEMKKLPYENLRSELIGLPGVGEKVADCVSLFGFGRLEAFPIDVWIERAMARLYGQKGSYTKLRKFAHERFGPYAGYAQEYLFHNERTRGKSGACAFRRA